MWRLYKWGNTERLTCSICRGDRKGWIVRELEVIGSYAASTTWLVVDAYCIWGDVDHWNFTWGDVDQWDVWKGETENYLALQTFMEYSDTPSATNNEPICFKIVSKAKAVIPWPSITYHYEEESRPIFALTFFTWPLRLFISNRFFNISWFVTVFHERLCTNWGWQNFNGLPWHKALL